MKIAVIITRILLGLIFFVFGISFFFHLIPAKPMPGAAGEFTKGLFDSGYFLYLLKAIETTSGFFLIINRFTALFVLVLFPIMVNIVFFHSFLEPSGLPMVAPMLLIELFLIYAYRKYYTSMLTVSPVV